jgi:hypothetical protein
MGFFMTAPLQEMTNARDATQDALGDADRIGLRIRICAGPALVHRRRSGKGGDR